MAKNKTPRISVNKFKSLMEDNTVSFPLSEIYGDDNETMVIVRRRIPLHSMQEFVESVVQSCVDDETGLYMPEAKEFVTRLFVLIKYANFSIPQDTEAKYDLVYQTSAYERVLAEIDKDQYQDIRDAITEKIRHRVAIIESANVIEMNSVLKRASDMLAKSEDAMKGIEDIDLNAVMTNLSNLKDIDEEKMLRAVLDAQKTDNELSSEDPPELVGAS